MSDLLALFGGSLAPVVVDDPIPAEMAADVPLVIEARETGVRHVDLCGNQPEQDRFLKDCMPGWTLASGGVGSGKSYIGARKFLLLHYMNRCKGMMIAPTWADMSRLMVPQIILACQEWGAKVEYWPHGHGAEQYPHMVIFGEIIYLFSGDSPGRIVGVEVGHCWGDEAARFYVSDDPSQDTPTQIRNRLRVKCCSLHAMFTGTPEGIGTWIQRDFVDKTAKPGHRIYRIPTSGNSALPPSYVTDLRATLSPELQAQYLDGIAVDFSGKRAHKNFTAERHVRESLKWSDDLDTYVGCDFNVSPMCWIAGQMQHDGTLHILDELVLEDHAQTDVAVHLAHAKGWGISPTFGRARSVEICPDASSKNRSTVGDPEITVLLNTAKALGWRTTGSAYGVNPPVTGRINNLDRCLVDANQQVRMLVHPRCVRLIQELSHVGRLKNGSYDPGPNNQFGHILDALGYLVWKALPVLSPMTGARR